MPPRSPWSAALIVVVALVGCDLVGPDQARTRNLGKVDPTVSLTYRSVAISLVLPRAFVGRNLLAIPPADRYLIAISGPDLPTPLTAEATRAADAATLEVAGIPPGENRLIRVQGLDTTGKERRSSLWMAVAKLALPRTRIVLTAASTAVGRVWERWLEGGHRVLASSQEAGAVLAKLEAIKQAAQLPHHAFIDAKKWADAASAAGNLEFAQLGFAIAPANLRVEVDGVPANGTMDLWLDDPTSPLQSGLSPQTSQSGGRYEITPVLPGEWSMTAHVPGLGTAVKTVNVSTGATVAVKLSFDGWNWGPELPAPIGNAAAVTDGRFIYLVGGVSPKLGLFGGIPFSGNATDSVFMLDATAQTPTWSRLPDLPTPREGAVSTLVGSKLFVICGRDAKTRYFDTYVLDLSNPGSWIPLSSPGLFSGTSEPDLPIGAFDDGGRPALFWSVFDESATPPFGSGHSHRFDPLAGIWAKDPADLPGVRTPRRRVGVGRLGDLVVVAGGDRQAVREGAAPPGALTAAVGTVEAFDLLTRSWAAWPDLPFGRSELALAEARGSLYAVGGVDALDYPLNIADRFDTKTGQWLPGPALREARSSFSLVFAGGKLWAIGGAPSRKLNRSEVFALPSAVMLRSVETLKVEQNP